MTDKPKVAIVILNYNGYSYLGDILRKSVESAIQQSYNNIEVLFVDNGSTDDSVQYILQMFNDYWVTGRLKVIRLLKNVGFCLANNIALKYTNAKYILFQNSDAILANDYIEKLVEILESDSKIAAIQGLEVNPFKKYYKIGGTLKIDGYYFIEEYGHFRELLLVFGAAMLVRRRYFELVGGFSSDYFMYHDEADLGFKFKALGLKMIGTTFTKYIHLIGETVSKSSELHYVTTYFAERNRLTTILRYFYGCYLVKAIFYNVILLLRSFVKGPSLKRYVIVKASLRVMMKIPSIIQYCRIYVKGLRKHKVLETYLVKKIK